MQDKVKPGPLKDGKVGKTDMITIVGTGSSFLKKGEKVDVHKIHGEKLIKDSKAKLA
jgi:hypothetical protein